MHRSVPLLLLCALFGCHSASNDAPGGGDAASDTPVDGGVDGAGACSADPTAKPGKVVVEQGALVGTSQGGTWSYLGVPYAAPPVGDLRWKPPRPAACWGGERKADQFGSKCVQQSTTGTNIVGSEDCLTLNVWTPSDATADAKLPVLVFVHGGANIYGSAADTATDGSLFYDGAELASRRHVVVVTMNYRVAAMGFFAHAGLDAERTEKASGSWAFLDQIAALQWVQKNVRVFGGDASHVLLFGESAGATDVGVLFASPLTKGLFSSVLAESGAWKMQTHDEALTYGKKLVDANGCAKGSDAETIVCLRALPPETIAKSLPQSFSLTAPTATAIFRPSIDGWVVPEQPTDRVAAGKHNPVPLIVGTNADEISLGIPDMTDAEYHAQLNALAGSTAGGDAVYAQYPPSDWGTPRDAYVAVLSDVIFTCPTRRFARAAAKGQTLPVRRYFFTHALQGAGDATKKLGAFHGLDLPFVFHHLTVNFYTPTAGENALADAIENYWTRFAASGDPNGGSDVSWPLYDATKDSVLLLEDPIVAGGPVRSKQCDFWDLVTP